MASSRPADTDKSVRVHWIVGICALLLVGSGITAVAVYQRYHSVPAVRLEPGGVIYTYDASAGQQTAIEGMAFGIDVVIVGNHQPTVTSVTPFGVVGHPILSSVFFIPFGGNLGTYDAIQLAKVVPAAQAKLAVRVGGKLYLPNPALQKAWHGSNPRADWQLVVVMRSATRVTALTGIKGFAIHLRWSNGQTQAIKTSDGICFAPNQRVINAGCFSG